MESFLIVGVWLDCITCSQHQRQQSLNKIYFCSAEVMVPHPASFVASLLILSALHLPTAVESQSQSDGCSMQPVARRIDPPSGTAGRDPRTITKYTIIGESLDQVSSITVLLIDGTGRTVTIVDRMGNSTVVTFHIPDLNLNEMRDALISLRPSDLDCLVTNLTVVLFPECKYSSAIPQNVCALHLKKNFKKGEGLLFAILLGCCGIMDIP